MITINGPFLIALAIIISLIVIKWIEWYLFQNGTIQWRRKPRKSVESKNSLKLSDFGTKLKNTLFFGKAELKRPWYTGIPIFIFIMTNQFFIIVLDFKLWQILTYFVLAIILNILFEILILFRSNSEFFSLAERRIRFVKTQILQGILCILLSVIFFNALSALDFKHNQPDPPGLKESVNWSIEPIYDGYWAEFSEGLAAVEKKGEEGYIDKKGNTVIPFQFEQAGKFQEGLAPVKKNGKWGYINQKGNVIIPFQYEEAFPFGDGLAPVKTNSKWVVIDMQGAVKFQTEYEYIYPFNEGVAIVDIRDKHDTRLITSNLIDTKGNLLFKNNYTFNGSYREGCIPVMDARSGKGYFLDRYEKKAIPLDFLDAGNFIDGNAAVRLETGEYVLIDHNGSIARKLREWEYYGFLNQSEGLSIFSEGDWEKNTLRYGFRDKYGNIIIPAEFQDVTSSGDGMIAMTVDGRWGFIENPLPMAARKIDPVYWAQDKTQIATVEGLPVYAGELESFAYSIKNSNPAAHGNTVYQRAFDQIKLIKASEKYDLPIELGKIQYQIGDNYYKKLLL